MKIAAKERKFWICMLIIVFVLGWSVFCSADFYVIAAGKRAKKTVLVSPKATATQSGTALFDALARITDASEDNPYLIIIEPGIYDIQGGTLQMKEYVHIQGSGEIVTTVTGDIDSALSGVVRGVNNAELRFLTVENTGGGFEAVAIYNNGASPMLTNLTATASGATVGNTGIYNESSSPTMMNVTATASGGGGKLRCLQLLLLAQNDERDGRG